MPIDSPHPAYSANIAKWKRCRDAYEGEDAVKAAAASYLPMLGGQTAQEYEAYKTRALFYEAVGRTIDGFTGAVARKEPLVKVPAKLQPVIDDITADGVDLLEFIKRICAENLLMGRMGLLVDFDETRQRSYLSLYTAESIINWFNGGKDGVILQETVYVADPKDKFKLAVVTQYRELLIENGVYVVNFWRRKTGAGGADPLGEWQIVETRTPQVRGAALTELPWFWLTPSGSTPAVDKPPLIGLVNVAMSHYRSSADLEHGRHFTGLPTLWISGDRGDEPIHIGAATVLRLPDPAAKCGYAEFTGQGLGSIENALESKERMMAALGAAVIGDRRKGVEAAETARIRSSGETSLLMGVVNTVEEVIEAALQKAAGWMGLADKIEVEVNRDFVDIQLAPQQIVALLQAWQTGAISLETFLYNLSQGEVLPPDIDLKAEAASLQSKADKKAASEQLTVRPA